MLPDGLESYNLNWETLKIMTSGISSIDANDYLTNFTTREEALSFIEGYGYDLEDPIQNAEMFGNFQEALQFIKKYFLKEGNPDGYDFELPNIFYSVTDVADLLLIAAESGEFEVSKEDSLWAEIILKVMHTILHLDKDIRYRYFSTIQTQILDRFYKYLIRIEDELFLGSDDKKTQIPLVGFETKSKKTRESIIIKLLHKKENVAEELFDRIGIRFVTHNKVDCLRVLNFLNENHVVMVNNIKPSRSHNSLFDLEKCKTNIDQYLEKQTGLLEESVLSKYMEDEIENCSIEVDDRRVNSHSSTSYKAIHFTCRQLIKYKNPFYQNFNKVRIFAKKNDPNNEITKKILNLDTSNIAKDVRFFYPFEVQVTDQKSHVENTRGEASHQEYKKSQVVSAANRLFKVLLELKSS